MWKNKWNNISYLMSVDQSLFSSEEKKFNTKQMESI